MNILPADTPGIQHALTVLQSGGIIAHATETCYGLACDLRNPDAVMKLFRIKQRPLDQPVSALFSSLTEAKKYVTWNDEVQKLADEYLPGPLTLILPLHPHPPSALLITPTNTRSNEVTNSHSAGLRFSSHPLAQQLVKKFGSPLSTTSANLHGQPNPYSAEEIVRQFTGQEFQPDLILDSGTLPKTPPSTVINLAHPEANILRKGSLDPIKK